MVCVCVFIFLCTVTLPLLLLLLLVFCIDSLHPLVDCGLDCDGDTTDGLAAEAELDFLPYIDISDV